MMTTTCQNTAAYRFTWPGRDESHICTEHVGKLRNVADAICLPLQIIPMNEAEARPMCAQKVSK